MAENNTLDKLKQAKKTLESARTRQSELTGQRKGLLQRLKNEHGCETSEEAEKKLKHLDEQITEERGQLDEALQELDDLQKEIAEAL